MSEQNSADKSSKEEDFNPGRFFPVIPFAFGIILLFIGGSAALFYLLFSEYTGVRNWWLLFCGAPVIVVILGITIVFSLYQRYGRPLRHILKAIDSVSEGDLSVRVPEDESDLYSDLSSRFNRMIGELDRAEQQRRNLTADIAHELRTPLHIIQGNLEGVIDGVYQPTPEHINNTLEETRLLSRLVNDLQTLSLMEMGQLPLHLTRFRLAALMADILSSFSTQAAARDIQLASNIQDPELEISADFDRLNQALSNLVSNALRYTSPGGRVVIEAAGKSSRSPRTSDKSRVQIRVRDTGTGIPAQDLPFIFDRFWRADKSRTGRVHTGLGLAITRHLLQAHAGDINVESEPGKGTVFTIDLPG